MTDGRFTDTDPVFTADGLYLAFLSRRSFDPVYDAQSFDLSFPFGAGPTWSRWPRPRCRRSARCPAAGDRRGRGPPAPDQGHDCGTMLRGRGRGRTVAVATPERWPRPAAWSRVPVAEARYSGLRAVKGGLAWLREPLTGVLGEGGARPGRRGPRPALERFDLRKREVTVLAGEVDWFDGQRRRHPAGGQGPRRPARPARPSRKADRRLGRTVTVDLSRARFLADPAALWRHAYAEAGRLMRRDFWVPDMSGVDWDGVLGAVPAPARPGRAARTSSPT